jgi:ribonucleoside-diphosphate reductase beta chain
MQKIFNCNKITKMSSNKLSRRYGLFPIQNPGEYEAYVDLEANFWTAYELEYVRDKEDYESLRKPDSTGRNKIMKRLIDMILGFFSPGDGLICDNLVDNFLKTADTMESKLFFIAQLHNEAIHAITYSLIIDTMIEDPSEKKNVIEMVDDLPVLTSKAELMNKYKNDIKLNTSERYVAYAAAEGIFFCVLFNIIYWFRSKNMFANFIFANEKIAQDEGLHRDFGCLQFKRYNAVDNISESRVVEIIKEFVSVEAMFITEMLQTDIDDLKQDSMLKYLHTVADNLIVQLGFKPHYGEKYCPTYLNDINLPSKNNFYEVRVGNYKKFDRRKALNPGLLTGAVKEVDPLKDEIDF